VFRGFPVKRLLKPNVCLEGDSIGIEFFGPNGVLAFKGTADNSSEPPVPDMTSFAARENQPIAQLCISKIPGVVRTPLAMFTRKL
jgi:hypothetical protein